MFDDSGSDSRKLCNSENIQLFDHSSQLPSKASPFPLSLSPPEVIVDRRRHGWVMSAVSSAGGFTGPRGGGPVRLGSSFKWEGRKQRWQREGRNSSLLFYCVCFFTSVLKRETQDVDGSACIAKKSSFVSVCTFVSEAHHKVDRFKFKL